MHSTPAQDGFKREIFVESDSSLSHFGGLPSAVCFLKRNGLIPSILKRLSDKLPRLYRREHSVQFSPEDLLMQRFIALLAGCEDLNDVDLLREDKGYIAAVGKRRLASTATLCRFEKSMTQEVIDEGNRLLLEAYFRYSGNSRYIYLDVDYTPVELYGHQEGVKFNGHYGCNCYLPLLVFINGFPVGVFNGTMDGRETLQKHLGRLIDRIQEKRPRSVIVLRADSGFNCQSLIDLCEQHGIYYLIGLGPNSKLVSVLRDQDKEFLETLQCLPISPSGMLRYYGEINDYVAKTWRGPRRIIARDHYSAERKEWDPRFIQTNIPRTKDGRCGRLWEFDAKELYEKLYCARGTDEQYNQEFKAQAFGARASSMFFLTNSWRMLLGALCQLAFKILRTCYFRKKSPWHTSTLRRFRETFIRIPAQIKEFKTRVKVLISCPRETLAAVSGFLSAKPTQ